LFCPCWGKPPTDATSWDNAARNLSVIAAGAGVISKNYARAHQVNPDIIMLPYTLGPYLAKGSKTYNDTLAAHPERFAHTSDGKLINVPSFPNNYLMDMMNADWRQQMGDLAAAAAANADGVYVDSMGLAPISGGYTSGKPADPNTHQGYTAEEWMAAGRDTLTAIKTALGSKYVMWNGLNSGANYAAGTHTLAESTADGGMSEAWIRGAKTGLTAYPSAKKFQQEIDEMADMVARGKDFFAWTKAWASGTEQQKQDWNTFALAAFLLVDNAPDARGHGYYNFLKDNTSDRSVVYSGVEQADVGAPLGAYTVVNGVYTREFANATVTVNPVAKTASIITH
jgi:hypothetical protein